MIKHIFVDMDGVVADFESAVAELFGLSDVELHARQKATGEYSLHTFLGVSEEQMWQIISSRVDFWESIPEFPWSKSLIQCLERIKTETGIPWSFCSQPSLDPESAAGKMRWVYERWPDANILLARDKSPIGGPDKLLIDDREKNCIDWLKSGGEALLFPAIHNSWATIPDKEHVEMLQKILHGTLTGSNK